MRQAIRPPLAATLALAGALTAVFSLSCRLAPRFASANSGHARPSLAGRLLSGSRTAFGGYFQEKADEVFHAGVQDRNPQAFTNHPFQAIGNRISPKRHVHLEGDRVSQLAPWLWFSLQADPHNIDTWLTASHWLASPQGLNRPEKGEEVIDQGILSNPRNPRLHLESALLKLRRGRIEDAARALDAGLRTWPDKEDPTGENARLLKESLLTYRALIHESLDAIPAAIGLWKQVLDILPDRADIRNRIASLEKGEPAPVKASAIWQQMIHHGDQARSQCHRPDDHDHHHDSPHEHHH